MELRIKPFPKNIFPKKGLLIKGSSLLIWLHEMEILGIDLNEVRSFPIPSNESNILYGCFLIFKNLAPSEIGKNSYFQSVEDRLFIPENTTFYPKLNPEDWQNINDDFLVMHPEFGLVKLNEEIDWVSLINHPKQVEDKVRKPSNGITIPKEIKSFMVEMDDEKVLEALQKPQTEEEWMKNLPFDMKKVMAGNKKEIEKYLKYIEKYPERAVELGVPLDIMGTSRGDGFGKFKFGTWFQNFFGGGDNSSGESSGSGNYRWVFFVIIILVVIARIGLQLTKDDTEEHLSSGKAQQETKIGKILAFKSGITDIDIKIDSIYRKRRGKLMSDFHEATKEYHEKSMTDVVKDVEKYRVDEGKTKDSLKTIYNKKIVKVITENTEKLQNKIADSLKKEGNGIPAEKGVVKMILNKKQILMADSLGKLYGTIEPPVSDIDENSQAYLEGENKSTGGTEDVSISEIFWLIVLMSGVVGLYSFIFKKKKIDFGGENVPIGIKIFLMVVLIALLSYIFYPIIEMFGYNWFVWLLIIGVALLLYRLFREDKTILKSDDNE
ncbi:APC family permease [Chryseobacterium sp. Ch-15]|uniref:APC family permease n=1 Tax=Chryseobacterium muglaense TaxID=2893752 RepID=A0A9Q3UVA1_9FLAO|nr:APC family permease [Chryseobacterium muglaense]MBD3904903.1 APC family permease [Chryseobacterium muglaense]MCC9034451.1 APC family permease [Chryseobacterium muglaense]MCM2554558.1 APC family permease [Chryseobacterium muglaense]